jgi:lysophospholipase L1-like esterase
MCVYNYGKGGRTMTENHLWDSTNDGSLNTSQAEDRAWIKTAEHTACMKNAENFDLVLIMLGTNDANSGRAAEAGFNFDAIYERAFINGCKSIVNELKAKNPDVRIALLNCPVAFRADIEDYAARYIRKYQEKAAEQLGLDLLDMYTFTSTNTTSADYPDSLHPKDEGYITFAEGIYEMITPIVKQLLSK